MPSTTLRALGGATVLTAAILAAGTAHSAATPCGSAPMNVIATIPDATPRTYSMAVDPGVHRAYAQRRAGGVTVIDTITKAVVGTVAVSSPSWPPYGGGGIAADSALHRIYVTGDHAISVIDTKTNKLLFVMTDPVDPTAQPRTVTVDSRTHNIWVVRVSAAAQTVVVYNIIGVRLGTLATRDAEAVPVTFDPYLDRAYVAQSGQIAVADAKTLGIFSSLVDAPAVTFGVAVDPNTHDIWMAADRSTTTLDPLGLKIGSWPAGSQQVVVDPVTRRVYALTGGNGLHGQVTAYAADSRAKIGSLLLDSSLSEALDPSTGNLIVSTSTGFTVIANRCP